MYTIRKEYKGAIVFNRETCDYIYINEEIFSYLLKIKELKYLDNLSNENRDFINYFIKLNILTKDLKWNGNFITSNQYQKNQLISPPVVFYQITQRCNINCLHCFTNSGKIKEDELNTNEIYGMIDQLNNAGVCELVIGGGEPLTRKDLFLVIDYANKKDLKVSLTTNGLIINKDIIDNLKNSQLRYIKVSLDGTEKYHDKIRGRGNFNKTIQNIKLLTESGLNVGIRMVLCSINYQNIKDIIPIVENLGCHSLTFSIVRPSGRTNENKNLILNKNEYKLACEMIKKIKANTKIKINISEDAPYCPNISIPNEIYNTLLPQFGCPSKGSVCEIDSYGNMSPCGFIRGLVGDSIIGGNIRKMNFIDIWNNGKSFNILRNIKFPQKCRNCSFYTSCYGGCRTRAFGAYKKFNAPDPLCFMGEENKIEI